MAWSTKTSVSPPANPTAATLSTAASSPEAVTRGLLLGLIGVACFSLTPVATRAAIGGGLSPFFIAIGRGVGAMTLAAPLLWLTRSPRPQQAQVLRLLLVSGGVVLGFPLLVTLALARVSAAHAGAVTGLLPLATGIVGALRGGERPPWLFWCAGVLGSAIVVIFAWSQGDGHLQSADLALFGAVIAAAIGYTEGALLSRSLGGWQTISWALVLAAPLTVSLMIATLAYWPDGKRALTHAPAVAWLGFGYVTVVSQFLGFLPWYRGLALGGVARVSQLQLLMPFLTLVASALLLHEAITPATVVTAVFVVATVAVGRWAAVHQRAKELPSATGSQPP